MKAEELIDIITDKIGGMLHEYGYSIDHDILSHHLLEASQLPPRSRSYRL